MRKSISLFKTKERPFTVEFYDPNPEVNDTDAGGEYVATFHVGSIGIRWGDSVIDAGDGGGLPVWVVEPGGLAEAEKTIKAGHVLIVVGTEDIRGLKNIDSIKSKIDKAHRPMSLKFKSPTGRRGTDPQ